MTTPVVKQEAVSPQPVVPPNIPSNVKPNLQRDLQPNLQQDLQPKNERRNRIAIVIGLVVACTIVVAVVLFGAAMLALRASGSDVVVVERGGEQFDVSEGFDLEMAVEVQLESGPAIRLPDNLHPEAVSAVVDGSVEMVSTVVSPDGATDIYRFQSAMSDSADRQAMNCLAIAGNVGGSTTCIDAQDTDPMVLWGTEDRPSGTWYSVAISGLPLDSTTLVTRTGSDRLVATAVINGVAYLEWPAGEASTGGLLPKGGREFGAAVRTVALDANDAVVWSTSGGN